MMAKLENLTDGEKKFMDRMNPAHVYCRLKDLRISKSEAISLAVYYRDTFYDPFMRAYKIRRQKK